MKTAMTDRTVTSMPVVSAEAKVPTAKVGQLGQFGLLGSTCDVKKEFVETETSMKYTFEFQEQPWLVSAMSQRTVCLEERSGSFEKFQNYGTRISDLETLSSLSMERLVMPRSNKNSEVHSTST